MVFEAYGITLWRTEAEGSECGEARVITGLPTYAMPVGWWLSMMFLPPGPHWQPFHKASEMRATSLLPPWSPPMFPLPGHPLSPLRETGLP